MTELGPVGSWCSLRGGGRVFELEPGSSTVIRRRRFTRERIEFKSMLRIFKGAYECDELFAVHYMILTVLGEGEGGPEMLSRAEVLARGGCWRLDS